MRLGVEVGYVAAFVQAIAFIWYCIAVFTEHAHTNPISWWLWLAETAVGLAIYADRTRDMAKWLTEAVALIGVVIVAGYLAVLSLSGNAAFALQTVEPADYVAAATAACVFLFWILTRKTWGSGLSLWLFQIALLLAAFPLIRATFANPGSEPLWPWILWTVSFALQLFAAVLRWDGVSGLLNPLNYAITHGIVAGIILSNAVP